MVDVEVGPPSDGADYVVETKLRGEGVAVSDGDVEVVVVGVDLDAPDAFVQVVDVALDGGEGGQLVAS